MEEEKDTLHENVPQHTGDQSASEVPEYLFEVKRGRGGGGGGRIKSCVKQEGFMDTKQG